MIMADGDVTCFKLGSLFNNVLHEDHEHFQTKSDIAIIQHGRFDLLLENSW